MRRTTCRSSSTGSTSPSRWSSASGSTVFQDGIPETAFLTLCFEDGPTANVQLSWLAPHKVRQTIVVGSKRMVVYDDAAFDGAIRIYDRGFDFTEPATFGEYQLTYRSGDMLVPRLDAAEPLGLELADFANAIATGDEPRSHARLGVEIVRILEAAHAVADLLRPPGRARRRPRLHARAVRGA